MCPLKVGYVVKRFPRTSETFIAQEILGLERRGVEVVVFALRPNDSKVEHEWLAEVQAPVLVFEERGFSATWRALQRRARRGSQPRERTHRALLEGFDHPERSGRRYLVEALWLIEQVERLGVQHLHAHFANHPAFVAMLGHLLGSVSYSFTAHAKDIYAAGPTPDLWRRQIHRAAFAVTVSEANALYLRTILGRRLGGKLRRLYNGVDLARLDSVRLLGGGSPSEILFAGRLIDKKGADLLLAAVSRLARQGIVPRVTLVGDGDQFEPLRRLAAELGVGDRVQFTGALPHQEVIRLMSGSQLFVLPCRITLDGDRDALPTVLLEAMALGLPCISTPVNGVLEIVDHDRTGLLVPQNDVEALAEAIERVLGDRCRARSMGEAGREKVAQRFNLAKSSAVLHSWFAEATSQSGSAPEAGGLSLAVSRSKG